MVRAVLFDAAGTLLHPAAPIGETYAEAGRRMGVSISAWRLGDAFARIHASAPPMAFPDADAAEIPALERAWWRQIVRGTFRAADSAAPLRDLDAGFAWLWETFAAADAWRLVPGARETLAALREAGAATAVVSNFDLRLHGILEGLGLSALLDAVVLPADARVVKPDPAIFRLALARIGVTADAALYVGDDDERDLEGARAAGLRAVRAEGPATLRTLPARLRE